MCGKITIGKLPIVTVFDSRRNWQNKKNSGRRVKNGWEKIQFYVFSKRHNRREERTGGQLKRLFYIYGRE